MKTVTIRGLIIVFMLSFGLTTLARAETPPQLHDFARMIPLTLSPGGPLYELPLPAEVYSGSTRPDLGDLALFNAAGEIVPFTLIMPPPVRTPLAGQQLPLFPLAGARVEQRGSLALQVRTDPQGSIVNLTTAAGGAAPAPGSNYLVDATSLDRAVTGFEVTMSPAPQGYLGSLQVEVSDDLHQWRHHASGGIAALASGERELTRNGIEFPAVKARYFRLSLTPREGVPRLDTVTARLEAPLVAEVRDRRISALTPVSGRSGEYLVRSGGQMPVDRLRLLFSADNSLAGVRFSSRADDKSPWIERGCATFYRLAGEAGIVESSPLVIAPTTDREWLLRIRQPGGGGRSLPRLEMGWQPQRLIFAARGEGPFRLAYGSGRTGYQNLRDDSIAQALTTWEKQRITPRPARAGASVEAGGEQALRPRLPATTWRKLLLWGALLLGVLLLVQMAWRLSRELGLANADKNSPESGNPVIEKGRGEGL